MIDVTVIADDLTGAADSGIAFALAGLPTFVSIDERPPPESVRIQAIDTDSRATTEREAAERVYRAARAAYGRGTHTIYKKLDSTLRGNAGVEITAVVHSARETGTGRGVLVVAAPAFPATGRTLRGGQVLVDGVPLKETEVWRRSGMRGPADLAGMIQAGGLRTRLIGLDAVRSGALASAMTEPRTDAVVCDAVTEEDLERIAVAGAQLTDPVVWVGSGGLARHLPAALGLSSPTGAARQSWTRVSTPVLTLVGSRSAVSREQARTLAQESGVAYLELDPEALLAEGTSTKESPYLADVRRSLRAGRDPVVVVQVEEPVDLTRAGPVAAALGRLAATLAPEIGGLVITGGDIARAVLWALEASGLQLLGEVEPGVPVGLTGTERPLLFVTKAGAFGRPDTLARARAALHAARSP